MARERIIFLLPFLITIGFLIDSSTAVVAGLLASERFFRISRSVVFIDNNPAFEYRKNLWQNTLNEYCTGSLISAYHVLTSGTCCNNDIYDQRVKVGSDHPRDRGYFLPVQNFTRIRFNPPDVWMSLCVIRLLIPANEPLMRLPSERQLTAHGSRLVWFGYGTNRWLNHFLLARQTVSMPATTVDFNICQDSYFNLPGIGSQDYCILTAEAPVRERNVLGLYDAGGPLVSTETNTIWGVGVTLFPYFKDRFPQHTKHQLFAAVAPYRDEIVEAMQAMDAAAK